MHCSSYVGVLRPCLLFAALVLCGDQRSLAQCVNDNTLVNDPNFPGGIISLPCPGGYEIPCIMGDEYISLAVVSGNTYTFSTCGNTWDTELTLLTDVGGYLGYNDNYGPCGIQSQISWTATYTGQVSLLLEEAPCGLFSTYPSPCCTLSVACSPPNVAMCYSMTTVPYLADPYAGTPLIMSDDVHSGVINIGFPFCFDGTTYTKCVISSNNYVTFDLWKANTYSPWVTVAVPSVAPTQPQNAILNPWQDIHPGVCGSACVFYQTLGVPPFRRFVVSYLNVPMYSCTSQRYTSQTVLYETTNCIGSYILSKPVCSSWNGGRAVHGLQNGGGSVAALVVGRNNTVWTASAMGMFYVPTCWPCSTAFTANCLSTVLPLELLDFRGHAEGEYNVLEWSTASEENTVDFIVERSKDSTHVVQVAVVPAAGTSHVRLDYTALDRTPPRGVNYYRLRTTDLDGQTSFSKFIALETFVPNRLRVYPVPSTGQVNVDLPEGMEVPAILVLYDPAGRVLRTFSVFSSSAVLELDGVAKGVYFLGVEGRASPTPVVLE